MREIKFEVYHEESKKIYPVVYIDWGNNEINFICVCGGVHWLTETNFKNLRQYTGLTDKTGKEICEGDIIGCGENSWIGEVHWSEEDLQWWCADHRLCDLSRPEIIGNIHENSELIE